MNIDEPANPVVASTGDPRDGVYCANGLTKREHAAIALRVPRSGDATINAMICEANRRDVAAKVLASAWNGRNKESGAKLAVEYADALLAELEKGAK